MRYAIVAVIVVAFGIIGSLIAYDQIAADDPQPEVLSGTELTIEDWQGCLAFQNELRAQRGDPPLTILPTQREDGEWTFNVGDEELNPSGDFYSCGR